MMLGKLPDAQTLNTAYEKMKEMDCAFRTVARAISVERIGENRESILVAEHALQGVDNGAPHGI